MKKFLSGLTAALLMAVGLVAFSGHSAQAARACEPSQYVPCQAVKVKASAKAVVSPKKAKVTVNVTAAGNVKPRGTLVLTGKGLPKKGVKGTVKNGKATVNLPKLKPGTYKLTVKFTAANGTPFEDGSGKVTVKVNKPKKKR